MKEVVNHAIGSPEKSRHFPAQNFWCIDERSAPQNFFPQSATPTRFRSMLQLRQALVRAARLLAVQFKLHGPGSSFSLSPPPAKKLTERSRRSERRYARPTAPAISLASYCYKSL